jgi:hypothetical protein
MTMPSNARPIRRTRHDGPRRGRRLAVIAAVSVLAVVVVGLASCGDDEDASRSAVRWLPGPVQGVVVDGGRTRPIVWARDLANETAVAYELCPSEGCEEVGLIGLGGDADDVVVVGDELWVAPGGSAETLRVVEATGGVRAIGPQLSTPTRLTTGGGSVFVASAFELYRFDPAGTDEAPDVMTWSAETEGVAAIVGSADGVWVLSHAGEVARVDPASFVVTARGRVPGRVDGPGAVAVGPSGLYVITSDSGRDVMVRLDPVTLEVAVQRDLDDDVVSAAVTVSGDRVLIAAGRHLLDVDPVTLEDRQRYELASDVSLGVVALDGRAWVVSPLTVTIVEL